MHKVLEEYVNSIWKKVLQDGIGEVEYSEVEERRKKLLKRRELRYLYIWTTILKK